MDPPPASRLPVPKRAPAAEAAPGPEQKRARLQPPARARPPRRLASARPQRPGSAAPPGLAGRPLAPPPGPAAHAASAPGAASRLAVAAATAAPKTGRALELGGGKKKRAPWDLKGQVSDLQAELKIYKEEVQQLRKGGQELEEQRQELLARNGDLDRQLQAVKSELHVSQEQAQQRLEEVKELSDLKHQLEQQLTDTTRTNKELEGTNKDLEMAKRDLSALLEAREGDLAQSTQENRELKAQVTTLLQAATQREDQLHQLEMDRRRLHNLVLELKGNIRVFCRVRPLLPSEQEAGKGLEHLHFPPQDNGALVLSRPEESHTGRSCKGNTRYDFSFDRVFPPACSQADVFEEIAQLVQTGSGKTYTMEGPDNLDQETLGMIPRAVRQVFQGARELEPKGWEYSFSASFLEIYNEGLRDLLVGRSDQAPDLEIRRVSQASEDLHVPNLRCVPVASEEEVLKLLHTAKANRSVAKTIQNDRSSRSHSVFQLCIKGYNTDRALRCASVLSLVDLAGSERLKPQSKSERLRETQAINASLSTLGLVILALSKKEPHVPYRNSKLTHLLQNSLGGNSKMLMFVNIAPLEENIGESLNSLRFASTVNQCHIGTAPAHKKGGGGLPRTSDVGGGGKGPGPN
ncbi:kinesin-like protein KIFC1 isoform X2 [Alligator mississippiensis]|uniref:kinesin-like protein KIFC1 isoform X2 n=1 Tax=Alligator mississippiensis TaxID=8496 RepID=UPI0028772966|nr:kinesin-like protein KIFC1 isoform X2 [Alligator mississippiensis]